MYFETKAMVLKTNKGTDNSVFMTLFTENAGKVEVVANGAKSTKSQLHACAKPFVNGYFVLNTKTKPIKVQSCDLIDSHFKITNHLYALATGQYILELCHASTASGVVDVKHYQLVTSVIGMLSQCSQDALLKLIRLTYTIKLMTITGHKPQLASFCNRCHHDLDGFYFSAEAGGLICSQCLTAHEKVFKLSQSDVNLIAFISQSSLALIAKTTIHAAYIDKLLDVFDDYVCYHLGIQHMHSKDFLDSI